MAKEYKTLTFIDSQSGRQKMAEVINQLASDGWQVHSKETTPQNYSFVNTCCLGCIFWPLVLLGKKKNSIAVVMEREVDPNRKEEVTVDNKSQTVTDFYHKPWYKTWWGILIIIFIGMQILVATISSMNRINNPVSTQKNQTTHIQSEKEKQQELDRLAQIRQSIIDTYSPPYCSNHTNVLMKTDPVLVNDGWPTFDGRRNWTAEECRVIITKLYDTGTSKERIIGLSEGRKIGIGMKNVEVIYSLGYPNDINSSTADSGTWEQWVYGNPIYGANYVYLDNGVVTSYQEN